jgi:hypothetical protein
MGRREIASSSLRRAIPLACEFELTHYQSVTRFAFLRWNLGSPRKVMLQVFDWDLSCGLWLTKRSVSHTCHQGLRRGIRVAAMPKGVESLLEKADGLLCWLTTKASSINVRLGGSNHQRNSGVELLAKYDQARAGDRSISLG